MYNVKLKKPNVMNAKKNLFAVLLFFVCALSQAQVSVNVNIGSPPAWGPAGYTDVRYYYLPDIDSYYDVSQSQYIYATNGNWIRATALPPAYRSYDLYKGYKVVINDYRGTTPYVYYKNHKAKYPKGYNPGHQKTNGMPPGLAKKASGGASHGNGGGKNKGNSKGKGHGNGKH